MNGKDSLVWLTAFLVALPKCLESVNGHADIATAAAANIAKSAVEQARKAGFLDQAFTPAKEGESCS